MDIRSGLHRPQCAGEGSEAQICSVGRLRSGQARERPGNDCGGSGRGNAIGYRCAVYLKGWCLAFTQSRPAGPLRAYPPCACSGQKAPGGGRCTVHCVSRQFTQLPLLLPWTPHTGTLLVVARYSCMDCREGFKPCGLEFVAAPPIGNIKPHSTPFIPNTATFARSHAQ